MELNDYLRKADRIGLQPKWACYCYQHHIELDNKEKKHILGYIGWCHVMERSYLMRKGDQESNKIKWIKAEVLNAK